MNKSRVESLIKSSFSTFTPALQRAAQHIIDHPQDIAIKSMRQISKEAQVQPSTMHRLAVELGFVGYEAFRDIYRQWVAGEAAGFTVRATNLQRDNNRLLDNVVNADMNNLHHLLREKVESAVIQAHQILRDARHFFIIGLRSLFPAAYYLHYASEMFLRKSTLLSGLGGEVADGLRSAKKEDALVVFSCHPYAQHALQTTQYAKSKKLQVIAITDSELSPVALLADVVIVIQNQTPSLFPSIIPALAVAQSMVALLVSSGGEKSIREIELSEQQLASFNTYVRL